MTQAPTRFTRVDKFQNRAMRHDVHSTEARPISEHVSSAVHHSAISGLRKFWNFFGVRVCGGVKSLHNQ
jgi:hypothetical protein